MKSQKYIMKTKITVTDEYTENYKTEIFLLTKRRFKELYKNWVFKLPHSLVKVADIIHTRVMLAK